MEININDYLPLHIKKIEKGMGSLFTFYLTKFKNDSEIIARLWIYLADWNIKDLKKQKLLLNSNSINERNYVNIFNDLLSYKLEKIYFTKENLIEFSFGNNILLSLNENLNFYKKEDELFMFFIENENNVIYYSPKTKLSIESYVPETKEEEHLRKIKSIQWKLKRQRKLLAKKILIGK